MQEEDRLAKEIGQSELVAQNDFVYIGNGPKATRPTRGSGGGWFSLPGLYLKCVLCGYMMDLDPLKDDGCFCGALYKEAMAGRLGSTLRDEGIEVYQAHPKEPN